MNQFASGGVEGHAPQDTMQVGGSIGFRLARPLRKIVSRYQARPARTTTRVPWPEKGVIGSLVAEADCIRVSRANSAPL